MGELADKASLEGLGHVLFWTEAQAGSSLISTIKNRAKSLPSATTSSPFCLELNVCVPTKYACGVLTSSQEWQGCHTEIWLYTTWINMRS